MLPEILNDSDVSQEMKFACGAFGKAFRLADVGMTIWQHSHSYPHVSVLVRGSIRVWKNGDLGHNYYAPAGILIPALTKHMFRTLEPDTIILCVHDIGTAEGAVAIEDEHTPTEESFAMSRGAV